MSGPKHPRLNSFSLSGKGLRPNYPSSLTLKPLFERDSAEESESPDTLREEKVV
jgi:hypothetical protein